LKREADQNRELSKAQAEAADVVTTTRVLSYAKAEDMVATLKKFLSSRGDVLADVRSNTLIIRTSPAFCRCWITCYGSWTRNRSKWKSRLA